jgi:alkanesulfonate monooxygenase SsuD/methylene tetrahydromethanopterin reductase-like flavin-dependent oxidoreductase (luciferase family)
MRAWHFTEMPYPYLPDDIESMRVSPPGRYFDPQIGAELYNRYLDEWVIADELSMDIMVNEHHQTATCLDVAAPVTAGILARQTKNARIVVLGNPIAHRKDPIRVAEEMAMIDNISRGRLEVGFVRGVPYEILPANTNPTQTKERMWEAHDLILKAWTTPDEPFSWEGDFFHYRMVSVWPRPYQQPHPPVWITGGGDLDNVRRVAELGHVFAAFLIPYEQTARLFNAYREHCAELGLPQPGPEKFAFMPLVYTGETDEEALESMEEIMWYLRPKVSPQFRIPPPGYAPVEAFVQAMRGGPASRTAGIRKLPVEQLIEQGVVIAGNPDSVYAQIKDLYDRVGGFANLLMMGQGGFLSHEKTVKGMTLFAEEVYPRIKELGVTAPQTRIS